MIISKIENHKINYDEYKKKEILNHRFKYSAYRGQSKAEYRLLPSILRNNNENAVIDLNYIIHKYKEYGLYQKYTEHFESIFINYYEMISLMQHACQFSPLLDITSNFDVATSFALSNQQDILNFHTKESAIFSFQYNEEKIYRDNEKINEFFKSDFKLWNIGRKRITFGEQIEVEKYQSRCKTKEIISLKSFSEIIEALTPEFIIIDLPTNDRMKYQKGKFILFYNCICINNIIVYELCKDFQKNDISIPVDQKAGILKEQNKFIDINHLLNPYLVFTED